MFYGMFFFDYFCRMMKETIVEDKNQLFYYSLYASLILGVYWVIKYLIIILGKDYAITSLIANFLSIGTPLILMYFLVIYSKWYNENEMSFLHGIQFSILMFFFASIIEAIAVFIHVNWIDTMFISNFYSSIVELAESLKLSPALTEQLAEQQLPSSFSYVLNNIILGDVFIGLLLSLIIVPLARTVSQKI
jgi:hypothetical protein